MLHECDPLLQVDALESSEMQLKVTSALAAANSKAKKAGKGLLGKVEGAVENGIELGDQLSDINGVLGELGGGAAGDLEDDDELTAELDAMVKAETAALPAPAVSTAPKQAPATLSSMLFPEVPKVDVATVNPTSTLDAAAAV